MKHLTLSSLALALTATIMSSACRDSKDDRKESSQSNKGLVPSDFKNTVDASTFAQKNQEAQALLAGIEQQFGMKIHDSRADEGTLIFTQAALQAFIGSKADSTLLNRSLKIEASLAIITRLLTQEKPDSCAAVLSTVEALYNSLAVAAHEASHYNNREELEKTAQRLGMELKEKPAPLDAALSFQLTGSHEWLGLNVDQKLDFQAGANDRYVFVKRDAYFKSTMDSKFGHYTYTSTGGLSADLVEKQLLLVDQRRSDIDMTRHGKSILGTSQLDIQSRVQGGELPSVTSELKLSFKGQGLVDEDEFALYDEKRQVNSQLVKVDATTLRLSLAMLSEGVKGTKNLSVEWQLQKNAEGQCTVSRPNENS